MALLGPRLLPAEGCSCSQGAERVGPLQEEESLDGELYEMTAYGGADEHE